MSADVTSTHLISPHLIPIDTITPLLIYPPTPLHYTTLHYTTHSFTHHLRYSLCAAIAAAHLHPNEQKIVIAGDGGFQMSLQELATLMDHGVNNMLVIVFLNGRLGRVQNESWYAQQ